jgi:hypothetical protein
MGSLENRPLGFEKDHWFVIISGQERLDSPRHLQVNGLACFTLGDLLYFLDKSKMHSSLGTVSWERQQQIKSKLREVFRL